MTQAKIYAVVLTRIRQFERREIDWAWERLMLLRDERLAPEPALETIYTSNPTVATQLFEQLAGTKPVRTGAVRAKVLRICRDEHLATGGGLMNGPGRAPGTSPRIAHVRNADPARPGAIQSTRPATIAGGRTA